MKKYPAEIREFIIDNAKGNRPADLAMMVNERFGTGYTYSQIRAFLKNHKIRTGATKGFAKGAPTELYPAKVREYIQQNHTGCAGDAMAEKLNQLFETQYTGKQIRTYYKNHNLNSGLTGRFEKGCKSWNKGKHTAGGPQHTLFQKGQTSHNKLPVGTELINTDGYLVRKIADPNIWKPVHRIVWEEAHGKIPEGHNIIFADRNRQNVSLENLILVTKAQMAVMNTKKLTSAFQELTRTGLIMADLFLKMGEVRRRKRREQ